MTSSIPPHEMNAANATKNSTAAISPQSLFLRCVLLCMNRIGLCSNTAMRNANMNGIKSGTAYLTTTNISSAIIAKYAQLIMNERLKPILFLTMIDLLLDTPMIFFSSTHYTHMRSRFQPRIMYKNLLCHPFSTIYSVL